MEAGNHGDATESLERKQQTITRLSAMIRTRKKNENMYESEKQKHEPHDR